MVASTSASWWRAWMTAQPVRGEGGGGGGGPRRSAGEGSGGRSVRGGSSGRSEWRHGRCGEVAAEGHDGRPVGAAVPSLWGSRWIFLFFPKNVCQVPKNTHGKLCRVPDRRLTAKSLFAECTLPWAAHGKVCAVRFWGFALCIWHTANGRNPVVIVAR